MKANELRIGNFVLPKNPKRKDLEKISVVTAIDSTRVNRFFESNTSVSFYQIDDDFKDVNGQFIEFIEPIPLTEEWLVKFGFYGWAGYFSKSNFLFDKQTNTLNWFGIMLHDSLWNEVHKFQNLYFALTGEELTIKQ